MSRKRALIFAVAAAGFLINYAVLRPFVFTAPSAHGTMLGAWAINTLLLLAALATGGGLMHRRQLRALVNDEVSHSHYRTALAAGFWTAMVAALGVYVIPAASQYTARDAVYAIVTPSVAIPILVFAFLELRAHRDA